MTISNLEDFGLNHTDLSGRYSEQVFKVQVYNGYYDDYDILRGLSPKERRKLVRQKNRDSFKSLCQAFPNQNYELVGTKIVPRGFIGELTGVQLAEYVKCDIGRMAVILDAGEIAEKESSVEEKYFSIKGLFAVRVEGFDYTNSMRFTEERILLVKAVDFDEAEMKAKKEFKEYSEFDYMNSDFRFVRWEFIEILDIYETSEAEINPEGTEVYSIPGTGR